MGICDFVPRTMIFKCEQNLVVVVVHAYVKRSNSYIKVFPFLGMMELMMGMIHVCPPFGQRQTSGGPDCYQDSLKPPPLLRPTLVTTNNPMFC